ncbi:MAG: single-stranded DNA-binding protein [Solobacterium sp.]|nr:single-stranded DNA-binding protein [Solobacterium sp.]
MSLNSFSGCGRLTKDPELRKTTNGTSCCLISLAIERDRKVKDGQQVDYINVQLWRGQADYISSYARKGDKITVSGRLESPPSYKAKDGHTVYPQLQINAASVEIVSQAAKNQRHEDSRPEPEDPYEGFDTGSPDYDIASDDLPFE